MVSSIPARVVTHVEDLDGASPGIYVVRSGTDAYFPVKGLIDLGEADQLGEFFDEYGDHVVTFGIKKRLQHIGEGLGTPINVPRTIRIGSEFFISALKDYLDWQIKWWREAIQNSVDAGATQIDLIAKKAESSNDSPWLISCGDNGKGMDEDTIINKFLVLGGTTKTSTSGTAGGFGKAKELLLLPWIAWKIHSRDRIVEGSGIDYSISPAPYRDGTLLEVLMPADKTTSDASAISFIQRSYLPQVAFTVNEKSFSASLRGDRFIAEEPGKAEIYFIPKEYKQPYLYVRTHGLFMFTTYIGEVPGFIIAEITAPSIDILTANRDGFRDYTVKHTIEALATRIAKDNVSALQSKRGMIRKKYEGSGKFRAKREKGEVLEQIGPAQTKLSETSMMSASAVLEQIFAGSEDALGTSSTALAQVMLDQKFVGAAHIEAAVQQLVWQPDFYIMNDIEDWKVPKKFFPETMTPRVFKLAKTWVELCRFVMMQLGSDVYFGTGFHFNESTAASAIAEKNEKTGEDEQWLMINPFKDFSKRDEIWSPSKDADLKWLYAAAVHECTHIADGLDYHDESFAAALTRNMARCADGYRKIRQIVGEIRGRGGIESDEE